MPLYAIGDLHLGFSVDKPMDIFGERWKGHTERIRESFSALTDEDTIVLAGDTSWGISLDEALADFEFLESLPGKKIILKGNHDYWWTTRSKMETFFALNGLEKLSILHNNCFFYGDSAVCGTRGWFFEEDEAGHNEKVMNREVGRLEASLKAAGDKQILCFLHYPPLYFGYTCPEIIQTMQKYGVKKCWYGHLHGAGHKNAVQGERGGIEYSLISGDYLRFIPRKICE